LRIGLRKGRPEPMAESAPDASGFAGKTLVSFLHHGTVLSSNVLAGVLIARVLGPEGKGAHTLITNVYFIIFCVVSLGMPYSVTFYVGRYKWPPVKTCLCALALSGSAYALLVASVALVGTDTVLRVTSLTPRTLYFCSVSSSWLSGCRCYCSRRSLQQFCAAAS